MKVLITDDDIVNRQVLETKIRSWKYISRSFDNGQSLLDAVEKLDEPLLIILDWMMPGLDGLEVCKKLRSLPLSPFIYIIMLTSKSETKDIVMGLDAGANDYLSKPVDSTELHARIKAGARVLELEEKIMKLQYEEAMVQLAVTASHEINNPLTYLLGNLQLIQLEAARHNLPEDLLRKIKAMEEGATRIRDIVTKLSQLKHIKPKAYMAGLKMLDLNSPDQSAK